MLHVVTLNLKKKSVKLIICYQCLPARSAITSWFTLKSLPMLRIILMNVIKWDLDDLSFSFVLATFCLHLASVKRAKAISSESTLCHEASRTKQRPLASCKNRHNNSNSNNFLLVDSTVPTIQRIACIGSDCVRELGEPVWRGLIEFEIPCDGILLLKM